MRPAVAAVLLAACAPAPSDPPAPRDGHAARETYYIVDTDSGATGDQDLGGCIFRWDRESEELARFATDPRLTDPQMIARRGDDLLLVDLAAETPHGNGALITLDGTTGDVRSVIGSELFDRPVALAVGGDGTVYIVDRSAAPRGDARGAVFVVDPDSGDCRALSLDDRFRAPAFLLIREDGALLLLDADTRTGRANDEGVLFTINPETGAAEEFAKLEGAISPLGLLEEADGSLLVFDANADPRSIGGPLGAVFRIAVDGTTSLVVSDHPLRDPVRACRGANGGVLFVDANADPKGRGPDRAGRGQNLTGGGGVFSLDPATGRIELLTADPLFVNPVHIMPVHVRRAP